MDIGVLVERQVADEVIRLPEMEKLTGRKRSSIYEDMAAGRLPRTIRLGPKSVGWFRKDVVRWQAERLAERDQGATA
jgi:prophage regulatory protein